MSEMFLRNAHKISRKHQNDFEFELKIAENLIKVGSLDNAREHALRIYRATSVLCALPGYELFNNMALVVLAKIEYEKLKYHDAINYLGKIKAYHSYEFYTSVTEFLARSYYRLDNFEKAHALYNNLIENDYTILSWVYLPYFNCIKKLNGVEDPCAKIMSDSSVPINYHTRIAFSKFYIDNGKFDKAGRLIEPLTIPETYEYYIVKAKYYFEIGDYKESKKYLRKTMIRGKFSLQAFNLYINIHFLQGNRIVSKVLFFVFSMHPNAKRYEGIYRKMAMLNQNVTQVFDSIKDSQGVIGMKAALGDQYCAFLDADRLRGKSLVVLPIWGVGDEMMVIGVYDRLIKYAKMNSIKLYVGTEPRFLSLIQRSFPEIKVIAVERKHRGPHQNFVDVSDGTPLLPNQKLYYSFDYAMWEKKDEFDYFMVLPMVVRDFYRMEKGFKGKDISLTPEKSLFNLFKERMRTISNKPKIGISWRSGITNQNRSVHYTSINEWGPIFEIGDKVDFINLQYDNAEQELNYVREKFGVKIHSFPDVDLFNDFESIVAIMANLDANIAPSSVTAELSGATGCATLNMINSAEGLWRRNKNGKDIFHRSIHVITPKKFGDKNSLIYNTSKELKKLLLLPNPSSISQPPDKL